MRNGYKQQHKGTTFISLPNLCSKPSMINDVHVPANPSFNKALHSSSGRCSDDPSLSPKVGCMGQVKKKNLQQQQQNYKQLGMVFPTTSTTSTNNYPNNSTAAVGFGHSSSNNFSYSKLLRLFSSKTLLTTPSVLATATKTKTNTTTATTSCSTRKSHLHHQNRLRSRSCEDAGAIGGFGSPINVADLDPPLPVIIKKKTTSAAAAALVSDGDNNNNINSLWKRRSGGVALKGLQESRFQFHLPKSMDNPPPAPLSRSGHRSTPPWFEKR